MSGWEAFVASAGTAPACLAKERYGSPEAYASIMARSPDRAAAIPNSCCSQSMYASAKPGVGRISPRSQTEGPNMYFELLGWLRPVLLAKALNRQRLRPSLPTASDSNRNSDNE